MYTWDAPGKPQYISKTDLIDINYEKTHGHGISLYHQVIRHNMAHVQCTY